LAESKKEPAEPAGRGYSRFVGIVFVFVAIVATINLVTTKQSGLLGVHQEKHELPLPEFAVPEARGALTGDANVAQDNCMTSLNPCPSASRRKAACQVRGRGIITVCDWFGHPLVISFWFTRGGNCEAQQDVVDRVARRYRGRAGFLSIDVHDKRETVRRLIRERGWRLPVGIDRDGAVGDLYRVGGCPTFVYAYPGGILQSASIGELDEAALARHVDALLAASARRARTSR
jgi:thiol-disulfide isomerase/thioredoxin